MISLGLDLSTQSLSAVLIDSTAGKIIKEHTINFAENFPEFETENGFIRGNNQEFYSYPQLYLKAIDKMMFALKDYTPQIESISISGHQHASVYLNDKFTQILAEIKSTEPLSEVLIPCFSRPIVPIWMDNSTSEECKEMDRILKGSVSELSGSLYCERFTAAQIRKFYKKSPEAYQETQTIHLISSFCASIFAGKNLSIDSSDAAGMNLMNLANSQWDQNLLDACAPNLINKLPSIEPASTAAAKVSKYFVERYALSADCDICLSSGDNPNSLIGCGAAEPGTVVISMGTSDTFFGAIGYEMIDTKGVGHIFGNPAGGYMSLICFRNGSLSREAALLSTGLNWQEGEELIANNTPYPDSNYLPFIVDEMYPHCSAQLSKEQLSSFSPTKALVGLIESQILNLRLYAEKHAKSISTIRLTGGASNNTAITQMIADVFQAKVERIEISNSAALGAAMRAANASSKQDWKELNELFTGAESQLLPNTQNATIYDDKLIQYRELINQL
ncbi:FGGY family carbohydrate kinase [Lentisphaera profundi]|uniref:FGGY family carbohydrate kinase n=1 Tax=Lentisphaera profundi TaxID=1658616 RepID=A0ABY7VUM3_9BACT|nr:FGGY family carbohydrate kinase [Lentisphaera profundi]WDE97459.1 FGGY family carbohydrate kinase [Lentisphaera profundi]